MTFLPLLLQATTVEPLPEEAAATATELAADAGPSAAVAANNLDILQLVLHASIPVQLVMLVLLFASVASWVIIFRKKRMLDRAEKEAERFEERFWSGSDMAKLYAAATERNREIEGLESIFEAGFREFSRQRQRRGVDSRARCSKAPSAAMRVSQFARGRRDSSRTSSSSPTSVRSRPYVGLFGTVWGIMIAFQGLANVKEATIAMVAPGHLRSADRHRDGPVRRDPGGLGVQPVRHPGRARGPALRNLLSRSFPRSCNARPTSRTERKRKRRKRGQSEFCACTPAATRERSGKTSL